MSNQRAWDKVTTQITYLLKRIRDRKKAIIGCDLLRWGLCGD
jgi:hypothetical protein